MLTPKIIAYDIIQYSGKGNIIMSVNSAIKQGWQPLGPVVKYSNSDYFQTMVKYEHPQPNKV